MVQPFQIMETVSRKVDEMLLSPSERKVKDAEANMVVEVTDAVSTSFHNNNAREALDVNKYAADAAPQLSQRKLEIIEAMKDLDKDSVLYKSYEADLQYLDAITRNGSAIVQSVSSRLNRKQPAA